MSRAARQRVDRDGARRGSRPCWWRRPASAPVHRRARASCRSRRSRAWWGSARNRPPRGCAGPRRGMPARMAPRSPVRCDCPWSHRGGSRPPRRRCCSRWSRPAGQRPPAPWTARRRSRGRPTRCARPPRRNAPMRRRRGTCGRARSIPRARTGRIRHGRPGSDRRCARTRSSPRSGRRARTRSHPVRRRTRRRPRRQRPPSIRASWDRRRRWRSVR